MFSGTRFVLLDYGSLSKLIQITIKRHQAMAYISVIHSFRRTFVNTIPDLGHSSIKITFVLKKKKDNKRHAEQRKTRSSGRQWSPMCMPSQGPIFLLSEDAACFSFGEPPVFNSWSARLRGCGLSPGSWVHVTYASRKSGSNTAG